MYRIAKLTELPSADFVVDDKALMVDAALTSITPCIVDKEHRTVSYLSSSISVINYAYDLLTNFDNTITTNYFTTELSDTYITANTLIHASDVTNVTTLGSNGAFLSIATAETAKTECLMLIQRLKEKAMNMFTANLDEVFKKQQSMNAVPFGVNLSSTTTLNPLGTAILGSNITNDSERYSSDSADPTMYSFSAGQFSLKHLLTGFDNLNATEDIWTLFNDDDTFRSSLATIAGIKTVVDATGDSPEHSFGFCNSASDGTIVVPAKSVDDDGNTIPVATMVFEVLKRQIYVVIKNVYMQYLLKLTQYPNPNDNL